VGWPLLSARVYTEVFIFPPLYGRCGVGVVFRVDAPAFGRFLKPVGSKGQSFFVTPS